MPGEPPNPSSAPRDADEAPRPRRRDERRLAVQALYVLDQTPAPGSDEQERGEAAAAAPDPAALREALDEPFDDGEPAPPEAAKAPAIELALAVWARRDEADAQVSKLAPDWPTHRQPPVDRAVLRLAWFELVTRRADPAVVINEAVELAKQFGDERTPAFVNGVLDRVAKRLPEPDADTPAPAATSDDWLHDAKQNTAG